MTHDEYLKLTGEIRRHMKLYYDADEPEISDYEYDSLMLKLKQAEKEHPDWITEDSPTQIVGGSAFYFADAEKKSSKTSGKRTAGVLVTHDVPMLSIQDVFTKEEVLSWVSEVRNMHPDALFCVEQKIDGLSMSLRYTDGKLTMAETRGDGLTGEDITPNTKAIPDVKQELNKAYDYLEVRGEVYMTHAAFDKTNELQELSGKKTFANPRNCAAGTLRQLDAKAVKERGLSFFIFNIQKASDEKLFTSHSAALEILEKEEGMPTAPRALCKTDEEIIAAIDAIGEKRGELEYDIDGAVVKIDQIAYRDDFPAGSKYSAGHIAYKYPPEEKEAVITDIELSVGMTGRVNPTAVFTPIRLCGTTVSRATLHNQDFIDKLGIGIGKRVLVYKSGEIIPKIKAVIENAESESSLKAKGQQNVQGVHESLSENNLVMRKDESLTGAGSGSESVNDNTGSAGKGEVYKIPSICPVCGGPVVREENTADMRCVNDDCPAKLERRIIHFVSRDAMDIKGFGVEYIKALIDRGYIRNIADLYTLKRHRDKLIEEGLIGKEVNTDKLLNVIELSKDNEPWRLLSGLSIANVGRTSARTIMRHFKNMDALMSATEEELTEVEDVGEITAKAIRAYFALPAHKELIERLREEGVRMSVAQSAVSRGIGAGPAGDTPATIGMQGNVLQGEADGILPGSVGVLGSEPDIGLSGREGTIAGNETDSMNEYGTSAGLSSQADSLSGRTYCVTGDLTHFKNRDELIDFIEARGGKVSGSVSKKTYALINNDTASTSGKNKKAKELGIKIISEEDFLEGLS